MYMYICRTVFNMMNILPAVAGVVSSVEAGKVNVAVGGSVGSLATSNQLTPGVMYYATSMGEVISSGEYIGSNSVGGSSHTGYVNYDDGSTKALLSLDSQVGVALTDSALLVRTAE